MKKTSEYGVYRQGNRYTVHLNRGGKRRSGGSYEDFGDAIEARNELDRKYPKLQHARGKSVPLGTSTKSPPKEAVETDGCQAAISRDPMSNRLVKCGKPTWIDEDWQRCYTHCRTYLAMHDLKGAWQGPQEKANMSQTATNELDEFLSLPG